VIAALHATAPDWEQPDWVTICAAYDRLLDIADSPVARANRALAIGFRDGSTAGLAALDAVADDPRLARSGTVPSIRADLLRRAGRTDEALDWYQTALAIAGSDPAARSCVATSPNAHFSMPSRRKSPQNPQERRCFCVCSR
jgi:RNA polymerase sigma-70 factor (ECF subfamily)